MAIISPTGGTNNISVKSSDIYNVVSGVAYTINNNSGAQFLFTPPGGGTLNFQGNLNNNGIISYITSTSASGSTVRIGDGANTTLSQNSGQIIIIDKNATTGSSIVLSYKSIINDSSSLIDIDLSGASTVNAFYLGKFINNGTVKIADNGGTGFSANWGNLTDYFTNNGVFSIDNSTATSGSTFNLNFKGINNSGKFNLNLSGGSTSITSVGSGGFINTGIWKYSEQGNGGGNLSIIGGSGSYINNGEIDIINGNLTLFNSLASSGAETGQVNLSQGSRLTLNGINSGQGQVFNFSGGNNTLDIINGRSFVGALRGFSQGDQFNVHIPGTLNYSNDTGILTITSGSNLYNFDVGKGYTGQFSDSAGGVVTYEGTTPCFLPGTLIRTKDTLCAVENLSIGDEIIAYVNGEEVIRRVTWAGQSTCHTRPHLPNDKSGYPVRILKDAIAENVPFKDLLITSEHCLFLKGKFIPARMLVNGSSIVYDQSFASYDYYHIETEEHSVINSDGMLTESYLDTGSRRYFSQNHAVMSIPHSRELTWEEDAAAPLGVAREFVEPIFREIEKRANKSGYPVLANAIPLSYESNMYLMTENGSVIRASRQYNGRVMFMIPSGIETVRIVSNASRPHDVIGPFVDDRRYFGVSVGEITLFDGAQTHNITTHLAEKELVGWVSLEEKNARWTNGDALLPLGKRAPNTFGMLAIQIKNEGPYLLSEEIFEEMGIIA